MKYNVVEKFDNTGIVKTLMVHKGQARWRIYSHDIVSNMEDLKYYEELGNGFGITPDDMIRVPQKHSSNIMVAKKSDGGKGVTKNEIDGDCDGIITNEKGLMLLTIEADCTPVYILDPVKKAIGMVHSGWRGTVNRITEKAISLMEQNYGTKKDDLMIYFGPAICGNCYEVDTDLIREFKKILNDDELELVFKIMNSGEVNSKIRICDLENDKSTKLLLDVTMGLKLSLLKYGIHDEQMERDKTCTYHDNIYDSWRLSGDRTKQMLTGIMLI